MRIEYDWISHCWSGCSRIKSTGRLCICDAESMVGVLTGLFIMVAEARS